MPTNASTMKGGFTYTPYVIYDERYISIRVMEEHLKIRVKVILIRLRLHVVYMVRICDALKRELYMLYPY